MTNFASTLTEAEALEAWNARLNAHGTELINAAAATANEQVSAARGLNRSDYDGHGAEGRTAWYVAATKYVDEHCPGCKGETEAYTDTVNEES